MRWLSADERFWQKVDKNGPIPEHWPALGPCWVWTGPRQKSGYATICSNYQNTYVHRFSYEKHRGPIPEGKWVLHHCDNRACVRPGHLYLGDQFDNMRDMFDRGRNNHAKGSNHGLAKITEMVAREIYRDPRPPRAIADEYQLGYTTVRDIKRGRTWSHVTGHTD